MKYKSNHFSLLFVAASALFISGCGNKQDLTGKWEGTINVSSVPGSHDKQANPNIRIVVNIRRQGDQLVGSMASPEERPQEVPADAVEFKDGQLFMKVSKRLATCEARLSSDGGELLGTFKQTPYSLPLSLKRIAAN